MSHKRHLILLLILLVLGSCGTTDKTEQSVGGSKCNAVKVQNMRGTVVTNKRIQKIQDITQAENIQVLKAYDPAPTKNDYKTLIIEVDTADVIDKISCY